MPPRITRQRRTLWTRLPVVAAGTVSLLACAALLPAGAGGAALAAGLGAAVTASTAARPGQVTDPASLVNPFIGTEDSSDTFPGPDAPFGMVQWSPDTTPTRPDGGGYDYADSKILGFSLTHLSGPGCAAEGDIPILPTTATPSLSSTETFSHATESASAGYYKVTLGNGVSTALTATTRTAMAQFSYPSSSAHLLFKLDDSEQKVTSTSFQVVSSTEVAGSISSGYFCRSSNTYKVYFDIQFNQDITGSHKLSASALSHGRATGLGPGNVSRSVPEPPDHPAYHGRPPRGRRTRAPAATGPAGEYLTFNSSTLLAKVGLSFVSAANARANVAAENPGWDFDSTLSATQTAWNSLLSKITISGGSAAQQAEFYTALYHSLLFPSTFSDANGQYMGVDGEVHTVDPGHSAFYTNYSGWDIYRSQAQLEALVDPQVASDAAQSMVDDYAQDKMLPKWMENNGESYVMAGDPADAILADYYAFGAQNFDTSSALSDMMAEATQANNIRPGLNYLSQPGFMPVNGTYGCCNFYGPVSTTLEYDTADFAISALAGDLGDSADQQTFANRAQNWWNVLNPNSGMDQGRDSNSAWATGFSPASGTNFIEADSWIYTGMVPFDVAGLAAAKGGDTATAAYLNTVLRSFTGSDGYASMGNEPSIELPWEYDYIGEPYQTQATVRQIQDQLWADSPDGLLHGGNDDLGEMSSWFVWSALGMYPMTPGTPTLALGSPMFPQATITLPSGNTLTIDGNGAAGDAPYVQSASWDGSAWDNAYAPSAAITSGGTLSFTLGTASATSWASSSSAAPPSYGGATVRPPQPQAGPVVSGVSKSLCIDDRQSSTKPGNPVQIYTCDGADSQSWTIGTNGTVSALGLCLDVHHSGTTNKTPIDLYTCNGTGAQTWQAGPGGALVNPESGKCLDDPDSTTKAGTQLDLYTCNKTGAQDWTLPAAPPRQAGQIVSGEASSPCLQDKDGSTTNLNPIVTGTCSSSSSDDWTIEPDGTIRVLGRCLDVYHSGTTNQTPIDLYTCNNTGSQQWQIESDGALVNPESGKCLDTPSTPGAQLQIDACDQAADQDWTLPSRG
jgi:predicted alpha-1,2-mannosidase